MENTKEEFYKGYTFSPKINVYNFNMNFSERQEVYKQKKIQKEKEYFEYNLESKIKRKIQLTIKLNKDYSLHKFYRNQKM